MTIKGYLISKPTLVPAVVGFLVNNDQVLLGLRKKVSLGLGENLISGIGGKIEPEENAKEAFIREVLEEIEVNITEFKEMGRVTFLFPHKPEWNSEVIIYVASNWSGEPTETEPIKPIWFKKNNLPTEKMWIDNNYWVPKILSGKKVEGIFLYDDNNNVIEHILNIYD